MSDRERDAGVARFRAFEGGFGGARIGADPGTEQGKLDAYIAPSVIAAPFPMSG